MRYLLLLFIALSTLAPTFAQDHKQTLISGDFQGVSFPQFAKAIEAGSSFHFYYNPAQVDSLSIRLSVKDQPLENVLDQVLQGTNLVWSIDRFNHVFISKGFHILTSIPEASAEDSARASNEGGRNV